MMLKVNTQVLRSMELKFPGIGSSITQMEAAIIPPCPNCGSGQTARVYLGSNERSRLVAMATTKVCLITHNPSPGNYFCNECAEYFDAPGVIHAAAS